MQSGSSKQKGGDQPRQSSSSNRSRDSDETTVTGPPDFDSLHTTIDAAFLNPIVSGKGDYTTDNVIDLVHGEVNKLWADVNNFRDAFQGVKAGQRDIEAAEHENGLSLNLIRAQLGKLKRLEKALEVLRKGSIRTNSWSEQMMNQAKGNKKASVRNLSLSGVILMSTDE